MTNIFTSYKTVSLAAVVAFGAIAFSNLSANASATGNLRLCHANSKERFVKCCETVIKQEGKPLWFTESNSSCQTVVHCRGKSTSIPTFVAAVVPYRCNLQIPPNDNQGSDNPQGKRGRGNYTTYGQ